MQMKENMKSSVQKMSGIRWAARNTILMTIRILCRTVFWLAEKAGGDNGIKHALDFSCEYSEKFGTNYMGYYRWPKSCEGIERYYDQKFDLEMPRQAIMLTGLLKLEDNFTVETVNFYRRLYPKAVIIISTWDTEDKSTIKKLSELQGVYVVLSKEPEYSGVNHINQQIKTAAEGIKKAKELGAEYVLRTRTDVRIYRRGILDFLYLQIKKHSSGDYGRILTMSGRYSTMNTWYVLCDFLTYGTTEEMTKLYSVPYDDRILTEEEKAYDYVEKTRHLMTPESWLYKHYLDLRYGRERYGFSREDYFDAVRDCFIVIDEDFLQAYWFKHDSRFNLTGGRSYKDENGKNFDSLFWEIMNEENNKGYHNK